jgi:hypothetical protein
MHCVLEYLHPNILLMPHIALCVRLRCDGFCSVTKKKIFILSLQVDHQPASSTLVTLRPFIFVMEKMLLERTIWGLGMEELALLKKNGRCVCVLGRIFMFPSNSYFNRTNIITPFSGSGIPLHSAVPGLGHIDSRKEQIEGFYDFRYSWRVSMAG